MDQVAVVAAEAWDGEWAEEWGEARARDVEGVEEVSARDAGKVVIWVLRVTAPDLPAGRIREPS